MVIRIDKWSGAVWFAGLGLGDWAGLGFGSAGAGGGGTDGARRARERRSSAGAAR